jgi:hypothetical protein
MHSRRYATACALATIVAGVCPAVGQSPAPGASSWTHPKTAWGHPDLQGTWDYQSLLPLERPTVFAGKATFTDAEYDEFRQRNTPSFDTQAGSALSSLPGVGGYNEFWANRNFIRDLRTALIIDPPDGRIPPKLPEAQKRVAEIAAARRRPGRVQYESWEDFSTYTRCLSRDIPRTPQEYDSGTMIVQTPDYIVLIHEQLDTRIIPLDGRPHVDSNVRSWTGDSRGHWEGNTLVVDTTNFTDKLTNWPNPGIAIIGRDVRDPPRTQATRLGAGEAAKLAQEQPVAPLAIPQPVGDNAGGNSSGLGKGALHLIERFTRISDTRINYTATFDAPTIWARQWTFLLPWEKDDQYVLYEYACHEGELSIENALRGERLLEAEAAKKGIAK